MSFETILLDHQEGVGLITFNRPEALNALNSKLLEELGEALLSLESNDDIGAIVVTGAKRLLPQAQTSRKCPARSLQMFSLQTCLPGSIRYLQLSANR